MYIKIDERHSCAFIHNLKRICFDCYELIKKNHVINQPFMFDCFDVIWSQNAAYDIHCNHCNYCTIPLNDSSIDSVIYIFNSVH